VQFSAMQWFTIPAYRPTDRPTPTGILNKHFSISSSHSLAVVVVHRGDRKFPWWWGCAIPPPSLTAAAVIIRWWSVNHGIDTLTVCVGWCWVVERENNTNGGVEEMSVRRWVSSLTHSCCVVFCSVRSWRGHWSARYAVLCCTWRARVCASYKGVAGGRGSSLCCCNSSSSRSLSGAERECNN